MGKAEYIKRTYDDYFERLKKLAIHLQRLKRFASKLDGDDRQAIQNEIRLVEAELEDYAKNLSTTAVDVIKHVA